MQSIFRGIKKQTKKVFLFIVLLSVPIIGFSQSVWVYETESDFIFGAEALIPSYETLDASFPTGVLYLYSHIPLNENIKLKIDVPISTINFEDVEGETSIGNPYVGAQYLFQDGSLKLDLGVRLPVVDEVNAAHVSGIIIDHYNLGAFFTDITTVLLNIDYKYETQTGLIFRIGGGPRVYFVQDVDEELILRYYGQLLYDTGNFTFGGGLRGLYVTTEDGVSLNETMRHELGILASYDFGEITTGAYLRLPLDEEISDAYNFILGLNLIFSL